MNENIVENNHTEQETIRNHFVTTNSNIQLHNEYPTLKEGAKLPKSLEDWRSDDTCFHSQLLEN